MGMLNKSFKKAQIKTESYSSPTDDVSPETGSGLIVNPIKKPINKTPGKKVDLNMLFNTFTPIKPASPVLTLDPQLDGMPQRNTVATPVDFKKTSGLQGIMGLIQSGHKGRVIFY
jgi:hypothetical protein